MQKTPNIAITLTIATTLVIALSFVMPKDKEKYLRDRFWTKKTFAPAGYDIVIMGDSRVYRGVSPEIMEKELPGKKILNFGYSDGGLNAEMFKAAEKKINPNNRNALIILGISPNSITGYTQQNSQFRQEKNRPREEIFERLYLNKILYQFSASTPEKVIDLLFKKPISSYYLNEYHDNGYVESEKFPVDTMEAIPSYTNDFLNYKVEERYIKDLTIQVKEWSSKGIKVIGFRPPVSFSMYALENTLGRFNENLICTSLKKAGGHWIHLKPGRYQTYDGSHLNKESAQKLSTDLAEELKVFLNDRK